jgi:membrane-associated phospholipid phosphatase
MWQTEINIFFQSFSSEYLTNLFKFITNIGGEGTAIAISIIIMFGVRFRTGFILFQVCTFSRCINDFLKIFFALPRPVSVDSNVKILWKNKLNTTPMISMGAKKFFSMLPQETIDYFRAHKLGSFGFPSGTSTRAISFWGMMFMVFKQTWVRVIALLFIVLIPISRIYFGRHFLADVLGSFLVSFIIISIFYILIYKNSQLMHFMFDEKGYRVDNKLIILIIYLFMIPFACVFVPKLTRSVLGPLLGVNAGYILLRYKGLPKDMGKFTHRLARVIVAGICYLCFVVGVDSIIKHTIAADLKSMCVILKALGAFLFIWCAMKINIRLGFFEE